MTIRFSHPSQFNDTFDCGYSGNAGAREIIQHFHFRKALGILCLTESADNHLMWVHYAENHTGFVAGFRTTDAWFGLSGMMPQPVVYTSAPPPPIDRYDEPTPERALIKSDAWKYEKEWRCVRMFEKGESRDVQLFFPAVAQLVIGSKMRSHDTARLLGIVESLREYQCDIQVFDSVPNRRTWTFETRRSPKVLCGKCQGDGFIHVPEGSETRVQ
jgi:hypothetical protein